MVEPLATRKKNHQIFSVQIKAEWILYPLKHVFVYRQWPSKPWNILCYFKTISLKCILLKLLYKQTFTFKQYHQIIVEDMYIFFIQAFPPSTSMLAFQSDVFSISLGNGSVIMDVKGTKVQSLNKQYNDGLSHFIITSVSPAR